MELKVSDFFFHPVFAAATWATLLLSIFCSLFGCVLFVRRKALLAETLSHAAYLGVLLGLVCCGLDFLVGTLMAFGGLFLLSFLEKRYRLAQDVALTVTLAVSLSFGALLASIAQLYAPVAYKQSLIFLYGQAATMLEMHIIIFSVISTIAIIFFLLRAKVLAWSSFDPIFFRAQNLSFPWMEMLFYVLLSFAVVLGARACGIMLVSGMMIAPAIIARSFTPRFVRMLWIATVVGAIAAVSGTMASVYIPLTFGEGLVVPSGPLILVLLGAMTVLTLLFSPQRGFIWRFTRGVAFRGKIRLENGLKALYKGQKIDRMTTLLLWVRRFQSGGKLTERGTVRAQNTIRLHRLWELYVAERLGVAGENIHKSAEEMEHILDARMEKELTALLKDPKYDPHQKEIPRWRE